MIVFRRAGMGLPFLWESADQPAGRWHAYGAGPVHYFSDTPDGAWTEFLRHENITDPDDLAGIRQTMWAVELPDDLALEAPALAPAILVGGLGSYAACQKEAHRLRASGARGLRAPSAALLPGQARGWRVDDGLRPAKPRDGTVIALFGPQPSLRAWRACAEGRPHAELLSNVRALV